MLPLTTASKTIKYFRINLIKEIKDLSKTFGKINQNRHK